MTELIEVLDIVDEVVDKNGHPQIVSIKSNVKRKWSFPHIDQLTTCREAINERGNIRTTHCQVYYKPSDAWITVNKPYKEIRKLITSKKRVPGYGQKNQEI